MVSSGRMKLLRWAGSKSQSEHSIVPHLDFSREYIEPFCGSASFFFTNAPKRAKLNDYNSNLIDFYRRIVTRARSVWKIYNALQTDQSTYYSVREEYNLLSPCVRKAALFLYLNHYCFNGIYRTNQKGLFNTPFGSHSENKRKMGLKEIRDYSSIAKTADFFSKDFEDFLDMVKPEGACIYMDPPYFTRDARVFGEYGSSVFQNTDLKRLKSVVERWSKHNRGVVSYRRCSEFQELFSDTIVATTEVTRNVGGFSGRRKRDAEFIAVAGPI